MRLALALLILGLALFLATRPDGRRRFGLTPPGSRDRS